MNIKPKDSNAAVKFRDRAAQKVPERCDSQTVRQTNRHTNRLSAYHRLNGSSSPVLTATSLSYGKAKNSTPHKIKTPDSIKIKFGRVDYVGQLTPHAKFHENLHKGGFSANR